MTIFTRVTDNVDDNLAAYHNELIDGIQNLNAPDAWLQNGYFSVTVASNNITVAIKTLAGADPSSTNPVTIHLGTTNTARQITAALSVTVNAGTNTFNSGAAEFLATEMDYFIYLSWKSGSSAVVIGFARIPFARLYSDFSGTATNEKYAAFSTAPASTDDVVNVGRFAATNSGTASYNWSVPTFTTINLINRSIYETRWLTWIPTIAGFSANPTATYRYQVVGRNCIVRSTQTANGTSNATTFTLTAPFANYASVFVAAACYAPVDNGTLQTATAWTSLATTSSTINVWKNADGGTTAWTNANGKRVGYFTMTIPLSEP